MPGASPHPSPPPPEPTIVPPSEPATKVRSFALTALLVMAVFYTVFIMRSFLLPVVIAGVFALLLAPFVRALDRWRIPPVIGAALVILFVLGVFGYGIGRLVPTAAEWVEKAPASLRMLEDKLRPLQAPMRKVQEATAKIDSITAPETATEEQKTVAKIESGSWFNDFFMKQTPAFLASLVATVILLYFMLAYAEDMLSQLVHAAPRLSEKRHVVQIARETQSTVSKYLVTIACINTCLGLAVGCAMWLLGLPNPVLWGVMAGILNFVPYLGAVIGITIMTLAAILSFDSLAWAMVFPATYFIINSLEGNFITPMILGRSFTLNPIVIIIGLLFWGWIWGIPGMLLSVPILVTFKIFCDHIEPLKPLGDFLSTNRGQATESPASP